MTTDEDVLMNALSNWNHQDATAVVEWIDRLKDDAREWMNAHNMLVRVNHEIILERDELRSEVESLRKTQLLTKNFKATDFEPDDSTYSNAKEKAW